MLRILGASLLSLSLAALAAPPLLPAPVDAVQRRVMAPAGFQPVDLDLLVSYRAEIPPLLSAVETLLRHPASLDSLVPALRVALGENAPPSKFSPPYSASLWPWIDVRPPSRLRPDLLGKDEILVAEELMRLFLKPLRPAEIDFLRGEVPALLVHSAEDTALDPLESEVERLRADALIDSVMDLAGRLPLERLAEASQALDKARRKILESARNDGVAVTIERLKGLRGRGTPVTIGSPGDDVHRLDRGIVFDPGGNDRYEFTDTTRPGTWLMVIDLSGDDEYRARDSVGAAAAFLSVQLLDDQGGDDRYLGGDLAFGAAVMGYAHLVDGGGDDLYEARSASLGFAFHGVGILEDASGNDLYSSYYFSQGAASAKGFGLLADRAGNDQYLARPVFPDDLRYRDHFLSMSQGFSSGFAPRHAGGIAVLWDRAGEDLYSADIFGQGTGYWFGWGLLMDDAGGDRYVAHQYAQGAGVHFAVGTLWDKAGNDTRVSKGVSQGCGHDGGFGLLVDEAGDDRTVAVDMSAGAGSANGLGVYVDLAGDDAYAMGNPAMTLGHADMRRDRGSMGFFLDGGGGRDVYPAARENGSAWRVYDGKLRGYGHGLDAE
jgi:hypothetical protein